MYKKRKIVGLTSLAVIAAICAVWFMLLSPTKISFVNLRDFQYAEILDAKKNSFIKIDRVSLEAKEMDKLGDSDVIFFLGHGLTIKDDVKEKIIELEKNGAKVLIYGSTTPENDVSNIKGEEKEKLLKYLGNGSTVNYTSLLNFSRKYLDGKSLFTGEIKDPVIIPRDHMFHLGSNDYYKSVKDYLAFYKKSGKFKDGAQKVAVFTSNIGPKTGKSHITQLITGLEKRNLNVFPVKSFFKRLHFLKTINPDLVIIMPHGRFAPGQGDVLVKYLKEKNIPLICPINVFTPNEKWEKSQQGMVGGMLSQSITVPELDGGIEPFVLSAQYKNDRGLYIFEAVPGRVEKFCTRVDNWLKLKRKKNSEKRLAIYYYKAPGKNALAAGGLEVAESLFNLLRRLEKEGFNTGKLPKNHKALQHLIQEKGPVLGAYAKGAIDKFMKSGSPELVDTVTYEKWVAEAMPADLYRDVVKHYGEAPGEYLSLTKDKKKYIGISRVRFGNIVILPQPLPGYGKDESKLVHGVKKAPPHTYIASYLWTRFGFKADAMMHFGTHGSLEFTPWKQVALSDYDWPDVFIGTLPHLYLYTIENIGEAIIAKRRSYAVLNSHITPPFMEAGLTIELNELFDLTHEYEDAPEKALQQKHAERITRITDKLNMWKEINVEKPKDVMNAEEIEKLHNHLHVVKTEKVSSRLYVLGDSYTKKEAFETARLIAIDPIAYYLEQLPEFKAHKHHGHNHHHHSTAKQKAVRMVDSVLKGKSEPNDYFTEKELTEIAGKEAADKNRGPEDPMEAMMASMSKKGPKSRMKKPGKPDLRSELAKTISYEKKRTYIMGLKESEDKFKKALKLTNPDARRRIMIFAQMNPKMKKAMVTATAKDILSIVGRMKKDAVKAEVFRLLADKEFINTSDKIRKRRIETSWNRLAQTESLKMASYALNGTWKKRKFKPAELELFVSTLKLLKELSGDSIPQTLQTNTALKAVVKAAVSGTTDKSLKEAEKILQKHKQNEAKRVTNLKNVRDTLLALKNQNRWLETTSDIEMNSITNLLNGGYLAPSSGGDPLRNPDSIPTGRNLFAIDAERTPSKSSWEVSKQMVNSLIERKKKDTGAYPKKVAFTLWGGEFIRGKGITLGQIFYLLGTEPVWNRMGRVHDVKLIPSEKLNRPRIDVIVQTSGQFRDIAASRLYLVEKAVQIASEAKDGDKFPNYVKEGSIAAEKLLKTKGVAPAEARELSTVRVFGGANGNYGTGIMGMVEAGDTWEKSSEIAERYINNMGAMYTKKRWGSYVPGAFEGALKNTDTVVQPRSSNVSGPLSLDHVYEFMGGINNAAKHVTGKDPSAYFSDLRDKNRPAVQGLKEAIWTEARATLYNPEYIKGVMKGDAASAEGIAEAMRNTYGWNVMKPKAIDKELWDELYDTYIKDSKKLGVGKFFKEKNPYALQEITAVMLESARKGLWKAGQVKIAELSKLHASLVKEFKPGCSGFVCNNAKLAALISGNLDKQSAEEYRKDLSEIKESVGKKEADGMKLEKEEVSFKSIKEVMKNKTALIVVGSLIFLIFLFMYIGRIRKK